MMEYWVAFMREGQPAARGLQPWPTWSEENGKVMVFGNQGVSVSQ
jgi:carboxylesterase type B